MKNISIAVLSFIFSFFLVSNGNAQQSNQVQTTTIEVIQFHSEHRCVTCLKIEKLTRATLANYFPNIPFSLVNVEDKKNAKKAEQFQASGTALFLYNNKTGKKKELTDFAFMNAGDDKKFDEELKKFINDFIKS